MVTSWNTKIYIKLRMSHRHVLFSLFYREDWPYSRVLKKDMDKNCTEATLCTLSQKDHHAAVVRSTCRKIHFRNKKNSNEDWTKK